MLTYNQWCHQAFIPRYFHWNTHSINLQVVFQIYTFEITAKSQWGKKSSMDKDIPWDSATTWQSSTEERCFAILTWTNRIIMIAFKRLSICFSKQIYALVQHVICSGVALMEIMQSYTKPLKCLSFTSAAALKYKSHSKKHKLNFNLFISSDPFKRIGSYVNFFLM